MSRRIKCVDESLIGADLVDLGILSQCIHCCNVAVHVSRRVMRRIPLIPVQSSLTCAELKSLSM